MPDNHEELAETLGIFQGRLDTIESRIHTTIVRDIAYEIDELRSQFDALHNNVNTVLLKIQEFARREDLVDDTGGSLDEFIESFVRH